MIPNDCGPYNIRAVFGSTPTLHNALPRTGWFLMRKVDEKKITFHSIQCKWWKECKVRTCHLLNVRVEEEKSGNMVYITLRWGPNYKSGASLEGEKIEMNSIHNLIDRTHLHFLLSRETIHPQIKKKKKWKHTCNIGYNEYRIVWYASFFGINWSTISVLDHFLEKYYLQHTFLVNCTPKESCWREQPKQDFKQLLEHEQMLFIFKINVSSLQSNIFINFLLDAYKNTYVKHWKQKN